MCSLCTGVFLSLPCKHLLRKPWWCSGQCCHITAPGYLVQSWALDTVSHIQMFSPRPRGCPPVFLWYPHISQKHVIRQIADSNLPPGYERVDRNGSLSHPWCILALHLILLGWCMRRWNYFINQCTLQLSIPYYLLLLLSSACFRSVVGCLHFLEPLRIFQFVFKS